MTQKDRIRIHNTACEPLLIYYIHIKPQGDRHKDRETERQRDRETERQRDRETKRHIDRERETRDLNNYLITQG